MIRHCVIFTCKPEVDQKTLISAVEKANQVLPTIPWVRSFSAGLDRGLQPGKSGDLAVVADFDSNEDVIKYLEDPIHQNYVHETLYPVMIPGYLFNLSSKSNGI